MTSAQEWIHFGIGKCSLGWVLAASSEIGVCAIFLHDRPHQLVDELRGKFPHARLVDYGLARPSPLAEVTEFLELATVRLGLSLDPRGTPFQRRVWQALCDIPAGATASYWMSRNVSILPVRSERSRQLARRIPSRSRFHAIAWSAATAGFRDIAGVRIARNFC